MGGVERKGRGTARLAWVALVLVLLTAAALVAVGCAAAAPPPRAGGGATLPAERRAISARLTGLVPSPSAPPGLRAGPMRVRMVHHGSNGDLFWEEVHRGVDDAQRMYNTEVGGGAARLLVERVVGVESMVSAVLSTVGAADGLIVSCPYISEGPSAAAYAQLDAAIRAVIAAGVPVITFNTDTYHNPQVFQYVGSMNRLLGTRGARVAAKRFPELLAPGRVARIVGVLQERFNVTLDWRIEEFHREWNSLVRAAAGGDLLRSAELTKAYTLEEARAAMARALREGERVLLVPTGLMSMDTTETLLAEEPERARAVEVGDTGAQMAARSQKHGVPFVGQMQYQQGLTTVTSMVNLLVNYEAGESWVGERGNAALTLDATYECTEDCAESSRAVARPAPVGQRDRLGVSGRDDWRQVGLAIYLDGLDIARWDEYSRERVGATNRVVQPDNSVRTVAVVDGARHFGAVRADEAAEAGGGRVYEGSLSEQLHCVALHERMVDRARNRYEYYVQEPTGARLPLGGELDRLVDGAFVSARHTRTTYRVARYDEAPLEGYL